MLGRLAVVLAAIAGTLAATGAPAAAHAGGLTATDSRGRVTSVTPAIPGLEIEAIEDGARLRLRNGTGDPITIKPGGGTATPAVVAPGTELTWIDARATPDGRTVAAGRTVTWTVPLDAGGTAVTVTGVLTGEPRPTAAAWWIAAAMTLAAVILLARRVPRADLLLASAGALAATASIVHVAGSTLAVESAPLAGTFLSAAGINLLAWPLIIGGVITTVRGRPAGVLAVCGGAALTAVFVLPDVTSFHRAVLPFAGPAVVERILVVLALGLGAGVAVAGARVLRDLAQKADPPAPADSPALDSPAPAGTERSAGVPNIEPLRATEPAATTESSRAAGRAAEPSQATESSRVAGRAAEPSQATESSRVAGQAAEPSQATESSRVAERAAEPSRAAEGER